jgi:hypothetical protein
MPASVVLASVNEGTTSTNGADGQLVLKDKWCQRGLLDHAEPSADGDVAALDGLTDLASGPAPFAHQHLERGGFLFRAQVFALHVLNERQAGGLVVGLVPHHRGDLCPAEDPGRLEATVPSSRTCCGRQTTARSNDSSGPSAR